MKKGKFLLIFTFVIYFFSMNQIFAEETPDSFTNLQALINGASGEVVLQKDYENKGSEAAISITKNVTIDLNGHVINANRKSQVINVNNATLTIKDSNKTKQHKFDLDEVYSLLTLNEDSGTTIVNGGCITGGNLPYRNGYGGGIYLNNGTLTLESGNIIGNRLYEKYAFGGGISAVNNSKVIINNGTVSYNSAAWEGYGGGIYINNSELIINGGNIDHNLGSYGGGINIYDDSNLVVNDGGISNNIAGHNGGGIALMVLDEKVSQGVTAKATINGGIIENNKIQDGTWISVGGGIATNKGTDLTINNGIIRKNSAARGGGVGAWNGGTIKIYGGTISENVAAVDTTAAAGAVVSHGAGVFFNTNFVSGYSSVDAELILGGNAVITGNRNIVTNEEDNVFLATNQKINIADGANAPKAGMEVGINMQDPDTLISSITENQAKYFYSDDPNYFPEYSENALKLSPKIYTYEILKGDKQELTKNKIKSYSLEIDGNYTLFDSLEVGDLELSENTDYTVTRGSTIIKFTDAGIIKLNSLEIGTYPIFINYTNSKKVEGSLTIKKEEINKEIKNDTIINNPKTGDNILTYIMVIFTSFIGLIYCNKKRKSQN